MNILAVIGANDQWTSEKRILELAEVQSHLLPTLLDKLLSRGLIQCRVDNGDRVYRLTQAGLIQLKQPRISTFPPTSWRSGT